LHLQTTDTPEAQVTEGRARGDGGLLLGAGTATALVDRISGCDEGQLGAASRAARACGLR